MLKTTVAISLIFLFLSCKITASEPLESPTEIANHIKENLIQGLKANNKDLILEQFHPKVRLTFEDTNTIYSKADFSNYFNNPIINNGEKIEAFSIKNITIDPDIVMLNQNTFIATGTSQFNYALFKVQDLILNGRWTAVIEKVNDRWVIASYQNSVNVLDNALLKEERKISYFMCLITFIIGFIFGYLWKKIRKKLTHK